MSLQKQDRHFMDIAQTVAEASKCLRASYGAVIVARNGRIVSTGRNGKPAGSLNDAVCYREGVPDAEKTHECCIHAERNAIMYADPLEREGATLYVTGVPCKTCALHIMGSGITRLVYRDYSHSDSGRRVSDDAFWDEYGVPVERVRYSETEWTAQFGGGS